MDQMNIAREKLAERMVSDFKDKITGEIDTEVIGDNPENVFFVGKLHAKDEDSNTGDVSSVFIKSVGADFYINKEQLANAKITIYPRGDFFYRCYPTLQQQREAILEKANSDFDENYASFEELEAAYKIAPEKYKGCTLELIPVYKKFSIKDQNLYIQFTPSKLLNEDATYGYLDENSSENRNLMDQMYQCVEQLNDDNTLYKYVVTEKTSIADLISQENYKTFIEHCANADVSIQQNWRIYFDVSIKLINDKYLISVALINNSRIHSDSETHQSRSQNRDKTTIETMFNSGIDINLEGADFSPITLDYFLDDYKYDKEQKAIGLNCSVEYDQKTNTIRTEHMPTYVQKRLIMDDRLSPTFQDLIDNPIDTLNIIKCEMDKELKRWKDDFARRRHELTSTGVTDMSKDIDEFELEIRRFQFGIDIINSYPIVFDSFKLMNQTILNTNSKYKTWRLFQIVFIVSVIPDIVACDEGTMTEEQKEESAIDTVSLLFFPTGAGKTEAFLGVLVFNLFFDRFRGKSCGVTAMLRYPLRLLSVQQVQRVANILAKAEILRRNEPQICNTEEFALGYFVGENNTKNNIKAKQAEEYRNKSQEDIDKERIIDICPFCGKATVHLKFDEETYRLEHVCDNPECSSGGVLPIYMVDTEIYRYLPSTIISTVDKLAILGNNRNFRNILSGAPYRCPKHGFTSTRRCIVAQYAPEYCSEELQDLEEVGEEMYDPAPTLFIQDELHLIRESLGTYASHYESFVDYYIQNISPSRRKAKIIGATATITNYEDQITQLYYRGVIRFPSESIYLDRDFYSKVDKNDTQRIIMGYAPYGKAIISSVGTSLQYMREVVYEYVKHPEKVVDISGGSITLEDASKILEDYWIFLEYNNVKRDCNNVRGYLETPVNIDLKDEGVPQFNDRNMTGDEKFQDVRDILSEVENTNDVFNGLNLITATSMISHGVDTNRLNMMFFYGIPGNTAEYVQAYSRTGRRYPSIVVDIIRPTRETDRSYLNNFVQFHKYKDILIEPVPINRWATKAIKETIPGIFSGLLLLKYDKETQYDKDIGSLYFMQHIKKAISKKIIQKEEIFDELLQIYHCEEDGDVNTLGNEYREYIEDFVNKIFLKIEDQSWGDVNIFDGFSEMGYHIMNSLRDTESQVIIELD